MEVCCRDWVGNGKPSVLPAHLSMREDPPYSALRGMWGGWNTHTLQELNGTSAFENSLAISENAKHSL